MSYDAMKQYAEIKQMDRFTTIHFENWLDSTVLYDIQDQVRLLMLDEYRKDPEYWDTIGWKSLYNVIAHQIDFGLPR
jgi:hypothetical protein